MPPFFSVVVPHRNRPQSLSESLQRLHMLWGEWIRETIVVDDASETPPLELRTQIPRLTVIQLAEHAGPAACRNRGAEAATAPYLLFLDDDSWPVSGDLSSVADAFERNPDLAAVGFRMSLGDSCEGGGAFNVFVAAGAAVRRQALFQAGGFPEDFRFYVEEYALCYRLAELNYRVEMWSSPTVFHAKVAQNRDRGRIVSQLIRNNRRLLEPHAGDDPLIAKRLTEILDWYRLLAKAQQVPEAVEHALREPLEPTTVVPWSRKFFHALQGLDRLEAFCQHLAQSGIDAVNLWPIGKDTRTFAKALRDAGIQPMQVLDPMCRFSIEEFAGLPVSSNPPTHPVVVASFSPGLNWNARHAPIHQWLGSCWTPFEFHSFPSPHAEGKS